MGVMTEQAETIRTAILTVDDDPGVSRAVARDLRRRYGERHRIVRAESGASALGMSGGAFCMFLSMTVRCRRTERDRLTTACRR